MKKNGRAMGGYLMNHNCKKYGTVVTGLLNQNGRLTCQSHSFMPDGNVIVSLLLFWAMIYTVNQEKEKQHYNYKPKDNFYKNSMSYTTRDTIAIFSTTLAPHRTITFSIIMRLIYVINPWLSNFDFPGIDRSLHKLIIPGFS